MCGRARLSSDVSEVKLVFSIPPDRPIPNFPPSWNVAPTDSLPVVRYDLKAIDRSAGLIAPSRVVINPVGRVGDHKVRRDATEHTRNVGRHCAVAAEQAMAAEHP